MWKRWTTQSNEESHWGKPYPRIQHFEHFVVCSILGLLVPAGKSNLGLTAAKIVFNCKICGKDGQYNQVRNHIEANHIQGSNILSILLYAASYILGLLVPAGKSNLGDLNLGNTGSNAKQWQILFMPKILKFLEQGQKQKRIPTTMTFQSHAFGKSGDNNASLCIFHFQGKSIPLDKDLCITGITRVLLA